MYPPMLFLLKQLHLVARSVCVCVCVCVFAFVCMSRSVCACVCPPLSLLLTTGMTWHDDWLNKFYSLYMTVLEITVGHWPFSDQFQHLTDQNPLWSVKFPVHFQWDSNQ